MTSAAFDLTAMTTRTPEDVLAAVPIVLGFVPDESVVMLTHGAEHPFHARLDLPGTAEDRRACAQMLLRPALRHGVSAVVFVIYTDDPGLSASCGQVLVHTFGRGGVDVLQVLRSDGGRWFALPPGGSAEGPGHAYDVSGHVFTVRAVASGRVTRSSRAELVASVAADARSLRAVADAASSGGARDPAGERTWARSTIQRLLADHARPDPATTARLLQALRDPTVRDSVLGGLDRHGAEQLLPLVSALTRAAPADLVAPVASVLAFAAWLVGDGALAWIALDRASEGDAPCSLADRVARALELAMPPSLWDRP